MSAELYEHQRNYIDQHAEDPYHGLWWEQGTGKTKALIENAAVLYRAGKINGVFVLTAPGGERNWVLDELPKHLPDDLVAASRAMFWDAGKCRTLTHKRKLADLMGHRGLVWLAMQYASFPTDLGKKAAWDLLRLRKCMFICDEAMSEGAIKTPSGKRSKSVVAAGKHAPYRRVADGTPVAEGPFDFYAPTKFLDNQYWVQRELSPFSVYKHHYGQFVMVNGGPQRGGFEKLLGYRNLDELQGHLRATGTRVLKADCLDIPEKVYLPPARFDMIPSQRKVYEQMKEHFLVEQAGLRSEVTIPIVQLLRFQQIVCGYLPNDDEDGRLTMLMPPADNPRLHAMEEIRDSAHGKTLVFCRFTQDVDMLFDLLGKRHVVRYDGAVSDDECQRAKEAFQEGDAQYLLTTWSKGHTTITLHAAEHFVSYSNSFRLRHRLQGEDRAHRAGLRHVVDYRDVLCNETVDEHIVSSLRNKRDIAGAITGDELKEWI
jgi:hypothetical protein